MLTLRAFARPLRLRRARGPSQRVFSRRLISSVPSGFPPFPLNTPYPTVGSVSASAGPLAQDVVMPDTEIVREAERMAFKGSMSSKGASIGDLGEDPWFPNGGGPGHGPADREEIESSVRTAPISAIEQEYFAKLFGAPLPSVSASLAHGAPAGSGSPGPVPHYSDSHSHPHAASHPAADQRTQIVSALEQTLRSKPLPASVFQAVSEELSTLSLLPISSDQFATTLKYVKMLLELPWNHSDPDRLSLPALEAELDREHVGMRQVKKAIMELLAVPILTGEVQGRALCFVGPPGTGKSTMAQAIARALNRKFIRFSLAGSGDVSELKGMRRTLPTAMPGRLLQSLRQIGANNPVVLLQGVDELDESPEASRALSGLLEAVDRDLCKHFHDLYVDQPFDLSKVLFVCTASDDDEIPMQLIDRVKIVEFPSFSYHDKLQICTQRLIPKLLAETGLPQDRFELTDGALKRLISVYDRIEPGIKDLKGRLESVFDAIALQLARDPTGSKKIIVDENNLRDFAGLEPCYSENLYTSTPPGVAVGLAAGMGGVTVYIETVSTPVIQPAAPVKSTTVKSAKITVPASSEEKSPAKKSKSDDDDDDEDDDEPSNKAAPCHLEVSGMMGPELEETCSVALMYVRCLLARLQPTNAFFSDASLHLHIPSDERINGTSGGVTIATAFLSLALKQSVLHGLAMTGTITLTGKVLPVGGIRDKVLAAQRNGLSTLILPEGNRAEYERLDDPVKQGLRVHFASDYEQIFRIAFPQHVGLLSSSQQ